MTPRLYRTFPVTVTDTVVLCFLEFVLFFLYKSQSFSIGAPYPGVMRAESQLEEGRRARPGELLENI